MNTLVNIHAVLRIVKEKMKQALLFLFKLLFSFSVPFFSRIFIFFELCLLIPTPGPPGINPGLKNQSVTYIRTLLLVKSLSTIVPVNP